MKWIYIGLLLLLTLNNIACDSSTFENLGSDISEFFTFGCDINGPENTVRRLVKAYNDKDWVEYGSCFVSGATLKDFRDYTQEYRSIRNMMWSSSPASWTFNTKWTNLKTDVLSRDKDIASVQMDFDVEVTVMGEVSKYDQWTNVVTLEKTDDEWLISDIVRQ